MEIKWRSWYKGIAPQPIKLEIPGWAGEKNYKTGQPWHCKPFIDGSTYGLELVYPFDTEMKITTRNDELVFEGDFSAERIAGQDWKMPFSSFAPHHFGFTSSVDIQTPPGYGTMIMPHARLYTDRTGTVPVPVCGFIESDFWARIFFVVFKSPLEGQSYIFRKGEPYASLLFLEKKVSYNVVEMTKEEAKERAKLEKLISDNASKIATKTWKTEKNETFDNKYKILSKINKTGSAEDYLKGIENSIKKNEQSKAETARKKFPRKIIGNSKKV